MSEQITYTVLPDPAALYQAAAEHILTLVNQAMRTSGSFLLALSGGNTPRGLYRLLAQPPFRDQIPWPSIHVIWSDERYVPHTDPESCYGMARDTLLSHVPILPEHVYPVPTHFPDPHEAAVRYDQRIRSLVSAHRDQIDLVLLGMGPDGHTASLFPGSPALDTPDDTFAVVVEQAPKPPPTRISLTPAALNRATSVLFLVSGADKAATLQAVLQGPYDPYIWPAQLVRPPRGSVTWMVSQDAAA